LDKDNSQSSSKDGRKARPSRRAQGWTQNPEAVKQEILRVAREEFADKGLAGARVDEIAARTSTAKRMIYYYFGDKAGLYRAVLVDAYRQIRELERTLDLAKLDPIQALGALVGFTFDYHADHPEFVRLVMVENIHNAEHLRAAADLGAVNTSATEVIGPIYERGVKAGQFRAGLSPLSLHLTVSALAFYNVSNRDTILEGFGHDMAEPQNRAARRAEVIETVLRALRP
jgi:AcrR family transcriptional regulator